MKRRRLLAILVSTVILGIAAALYVSSGYGAKESSSSPEPDVEALRSLPYLGYASQQAQGKSGVVFLDPQRSHPGYSLLSHRNLCLAELIDEEGNAVQSWKAESCGHWGNAELLPDGDLVVSGMDELEGEDGGEEESSPRAMDARYLMRYSFSGQVRWKITLPAHHDVELTPEGKILTLIMENRLIPEVNKSVEVQDNLLALLTPEGKLIRTLSLYDLFSSKTSGPPLQKVRPSAKDAVRRIDLFHANSVEWMSHRHLEGTHPIYSRSSVLVCLRHQDTVAVVDWEQGKIVWEWGRGEISGPHDASMLGNGNILLFDNGLSQKRSRVVEVDPRSRKIVWEYRAPAGKRFFTASRGSAQRLPNGNTLIANSDNGEAFEVTSEGRVVWEYRNPHLNKEGKRATIVRIKRYDRSFIDKLLASSGFRRSPKRAG